jgi:acylphosphatase
MAEQRMHATVRGRVQGVGFRYSVLSEAKRIGVAGFVENRPDGAVYVEAEGSPEQLDRLEAFLREGPPAARVEAFDSERSAASGGFEGFSWR